MEVESVLAERLMFQYSDNDQHRVIGWTMLWRCLEVIQTGPCTTVTGKIPPGQYPHADTSPGQLSHGLFPPRRKTDPDTPPRTAPPRLLQHRQPLQIAHKIFLYSGVYSNPSYNSCF